MINFVDLCETCGEYKDDPAVGSCKINKVCYKDGECLDALPYRNQFRPNGWAIMREVRS